MNQQEMNECMTIRMAKVYDIARLPRLQDNLNPNLAEAKRTILGLLNSIGEYDVSKLGIGHAAIDRAWTGPSYQTCKDAASVCRRFERSVRRDLLSFKHHENAD